MHRPIALVLALCGAATVPVAVAGCGGDGTAKDRASGLTAAQIVTQSQAAASALTAYRMATTGTVQADIGKGRLPELAIGLLKTPINVDGEGPVNGDAVSFDFAATLTGLPAIQANITKVGGGLFVALLGTDYKVALPEDQVASLRPADLAAGIVALASEPREIAREKVGDAQTVHLSASIDIARVLNAGAGALGSIQGSPVSPAEVRKSIPQLEAALKDHTIDLWIGTADLLPRKATIKLRFDGKVDALPEVRAASLDLDITFSAFGTAVQIAAPDATETLDLNRLRSLAP